MMEDNRFSNRFLFSLRGAALAMLCFSLLRAAPSAPNLSEADFKALTREVKDFIAHTNKVRRMDETALNDLITHICGSDLERDGDEAEKAADRIIDKQQRKLKAEYNYLTLKKQDLESEIKKYLVSGSEFRSAAGRLMGDLRNNQKTVDRLLEEGVLAGAAAPRVRAAIEHGKKRHTEMQRLRKYRCSEKEVTVSGGRADCVSFELCTVWEFKPTSIGLSKAESQARGYISAINRKYRNNKKAARCYPDGFEPKGATYPACTPRSLP